MQNTRTVSKLGKLSVRVFSKIPTGLRPSGILLNDPHRAGRLIANAPLTYNYLQLK